MCQICCAINLRSIAYGLRIDEYVGLMWVRPRGAEVILALNCAQARHDETQQKQKWANTAPKIANAAPAWSPSIKSL